MRLARETISLILDKDLVKATVQKTPCSHVKDMFAPSTISQLLVISAAINFCVLAYFSSIFLVKLMSSKFVERYSLALTLRNLSEDTPWVIGKV